jgi:KDO2-lipid IV(A) lauroyltransferase
MAKTRSLIADYAVYLVVRFVVCVLQALSARAAARTATLLAWLAYHVDARHRRVADENLRHAFPGLDQTERDRRIRRVYRHFCGLLFDVVHMPRAINIQNWRQHMELAGGRTLARALLTDRPLMLVTGHFGNWEVGGYVLGLLGFHTFAIARRLDNPYVDDFFRRRFRERTRQQILDKQDDYDKIRSVLAGHGVLCTLADQDAGAKGQFVEFFGRPASTHKAVALLALEHGVRLLVVGTPKLDGDLHYRCDIVDAFDADEYAGRSDAVRAMTERFTTDLEGIVRKYPEQYFWLHRRWKHQPAPKRKKTAAA